MWLVSFSKDWADEFQAEGLAIYTDDQKKQLETLIEEGFDFMFGTNEGWDDHEIEISDFTFTEITEEEQAVLERLIPDLVLTPYTYEFNGKTYTGHNGGSFGQIPSQDFLAEAILNLTE